MDVAPDEPSSEAAEPRRGKCLVCGCRSTGIHYGVVACEGCKAFYKRGLIKSVDYKCYFGGMCNVGPSTGGRCKSCRFQKCVRVGMNLEATKMGRIPKRKVAQNNSRKRLKITPSDQKEELPVPGKKIAPAPVLLQLNHANGVLPITLREDKHGNWTAHASVIQKVPAAPPNPPPAEPAPCRTLDELASYTTPPLSQSNSTGDSEAENSDTSSPLGVQSNIFSYAASRVSLSRHDSSGLARFEPHTLRNLRVFYVDSNALDSPSPWLPSDLIPSLTDGLSGETIANMPRFLGQYWRVLKQKKLYTEQTVQVLTEAIYSVYADDFRRNDELMRNALFRGLIPHQPQRSVKGMLGVLRDSMVDLLMKQCRFLTALRGFSELNAADQRTVITEKWLENWIVLYHPYVKHNEMYYLMDDVHFCTYWASQFFSEEYRITCIELTYEFKCLRLTRVESFLFLAVSAFNPDMTTAKDKKTLSFLHAHYLDCLLQSVRSRQGLVDRTNTVDQLLRFMSKCRIMYRIGNLYVRTLDWSRCPVHAKRRGESIEFADAMALENDGLAEPTVLALN